MAKSPQLTEITDFQLLLQYLADQLHWPIENYSLEEITFSYKPEELGLNEKDAVYVRNIRQLRPIEGGQPWGIFLVEFEKKKLPVVLLRRILSHLVLKKRASANNADRARWHAKDLLFVTQFEGTASEPEWAFAHFKESMGDLPTLNVLGWDGGDTPLKLTHLRQELETYLSWPDDTSDVEAWRKAWSTPFKHGVRHTIKTADALAEAMAELARRIRDAAQALMKVESEKGPLRRMHAAFKTALIHDLTPEGFADTYAQTITYGLLTAAISRTDLHGGKHGTNLVADNVADMVPITNPFLKEMLQSFLKVGGRKGGIDFDELGVQDVVHLFRSEETDLPAVIRDFDNKTRGEDPVIHFYEHFLAKYNKKLKVERGVFYTPKPVVGFIVRSVDELLRTEFGIADGLASTITWREMATRNAELKIPEGTEPDSPFVMVLDPATGTATFLVEVIDLVHKRLKENWAKGGLKAMPKLPGTDFPRPIEDFKDYWNSYVALSLLRRLHGYELMMAPYAIAHMKIGLKLAETGYRFGTEERARVYLTNALEPPDERVQLTIADWASALAHEAEAVNRIKRSQRFTIVIGNPPYSGHSSNTGEWITQLVQAYYQVDGVGLGERNSKWLQDDYVKFIRTGQYICSQSPMAVFGFITNHGYIDNSTFRGLRQSFLQSFRQVRILDLHGNIKKRSTTLEGGVDENVFDIQQGVGVFLATRGGEGGHLLQQKDVLGTRAEKYKLLDNGSIHGLEWSEVKPAGPFYVFRPENENSRTEYLRFPSIKKAMPVNVLGFQTHRDHFAIAFDQSTIVKRCEAMRDPALSDAELKEEFDLSDNRDWNLKDARRAIRNDRDWEDHIIPCLYRPFDIRYCYFSAVAMDYPRRELLDHVAEKKNTCLLVPRHIGFLPWQHAGISDIVAESCVVSPNSKEQNYNFPLYLYRSDVGLALGPDKRVNFSVSFLREFATALGLPQSKPYGIAKGVAPADILHYAYAIFQSRSYCDRYAEFLRMDFPRLPLTHSHVLFRALVALGQALRAVYLLEAPSLSTTHTRFTGPNNPEVEKVSWSDNTVWIDKAQSIGFKGVPEAVWNYHVGGYQVCEKWLKDRGPKKGKPGRTLSAEDITHYQKIVVALSETIRIQKEIDEVIEQHGGWPGAFATNAPLAADATDPSTPLRAGPVAQPKAEKPKATKAKAPKDLEPKDSPGYIPDPGEIPFG